MTSKKQRITLKQYDSLVLLPSNAQAVHNNIMQFNDAFDRNIGDNKNLVEITGCDTLIYMLLEENRITFICRSKVLRAYIFCILVNYLLDENFSYPALIEKYNFQQNLTNTRLVALQNLYELISNIDKAQFKSILDLNNYRIY